MKQSTPVMLAAALSALLATGAAAAEDKAAIVATSSLTPETALDLAQAALKSCQDAGFQVAVSVVDHGGNLQVTLRDRFAGPHTPSTSYRKAWTALSFRTDTLELATLTESGASWAIRNVDKVLPLGGGVQIRQGSGSLVGAVGISGAPTPENDDACARAGIAAIEDRIAF